MLSFTQVCFVMTKTVIIDADTYNTLSVLKRTNTPSAIVLTAF